MSTPRWYETAIIYQTHVRAFFDANRDGIGDFEGLTRKLGYIRDLGATAIWLLPFYVSPLRDGGYDIADYRAIHPDYGTLEDFDRFVAEAHRLGLRVITELVVNHTSDQHPWFQRARRAPEGSPERDWYVWNDTPDRYPEVRIIFEDFEDSNWSWDPVAKAYYWHRFFHHQPDLNWDNPEVERAVLEVVDFWLARGVDGLRLDAIPYLCVRDGTTCENLPETHAALKRVRAHVEAKHGPDRMLLAEANQWPEDAVSFFGDGDECHMNFAFPLMPRLYLALETQDSFPIRDILAQIPDLPEGCAWALFLRNHDELTLEMVTHEERRRMWSAYATEPEAIVNLGLRRRLAPLLKGDLRAMSLLEAVLLSLEGTPIVYYGDEIGMGDDIYQPDRDGVRTPMQWSAGLNAGFSEANPQRLYLPVIRDPDFRYEVVNVAQQQGRPGSLLETTRRLLAARRASPALSAGAQEVLPTSAPSVFAVRRRHRDQDVLAVANFGTSTAEVTVEVPGANGRQPVDLVHGGRLAPITGQQVTLTLTGRGFLWLALEGGPARAPYVTTSETPWPAALTSPDGHRLVRRLFDVDPGPVAEVRAQDLDEAGHWWVEVEPCQGPPLARVVREVGEPEAQVILRIAEASVGLVDASAHPDTAHALLAAFEPDAERALDLRGATVTRTDEGWAFSKDDLRAVLSDAPGPQRHLEVAAAVPDHVPALVAAVHVGPDTPLRIERLPAGQSALAAWQAMRDTQAREDLAARLAVGLAGLHQALANSALESAPLTAYDARAFAQSLRNRLVPAVAPRGVIGHRPEDRPALQALARFGPDAVAALARVSELAMSGARVIPHGRPGLRSAWLPEAGGVRWLDLAGAVDLHPTERAVPRSPLEDLAALVVDFEIEGESEATAMLAAYRGAADPDLLPDTAALHGLWPALLADAAVRGLRQVHVNPDQRSRKLTVAARFVEALARSVR